VSVCHYYVEIDSVTVTRSLGAAELRSLTEFNREYSVRHSDQVVPVLVTVAGL
jgi:hypothetical protein